MGNGRWISWAEYEAQNSLLTHRSQWLFTSQILCFQPRPEHLEEGRAEHSGSWLFKSHQGQRGSCPLSLWLQIFSYCSVFSYFFLMGPKKLMRKHSCENLQNQLCWGNIRRQIKWKRSLIIFTFNDFNSISSPFQYLSKIFLKLSGGYWWSRTLGSQKILGAYFYAHWIPFKCYCHTLFVKMQKQDWLL